MEEKIIRLTVQGAVYIPYSELLDFQGELKTLSDDAYQELAGEILSPRGFSFAPHFWPEEQDCWEEGPNGPVFKYRPGLHLYLIDGHQRKKTVERLVLEEKYRCPPLPCNPVKAQDYAEAKLKVLTATSQYGKMTSSSVAAYIADSGLDVDAVLASCRWPDIDPKEIESRLEQLCPPSGGGETGAGDDEEGGEDVDDVSEPPKVAKAKSGELWLLDPYFECESCKSIYSYPVGKTMTECPCG